MGIQWRSDVVKRAEVFSAEDIEDDLSSLFVYLSASYGQTFLAE